MATRGNKWQQSPEVTMGEVKIVVQSLRCALPAPPRCPNINLLSLASTAAILEVRASISAARRGPS